MVEFEINSPVDTEDLVRFFARCGWEEPDAGVKLEWALAASQEWVVCRVDGEMVGFGRSCRLDPTRRVVFDVLIDARYTEGALRTNIIRLLSTNVGRMERVSVFTDVDAAPAAPPSAGDLPGPHFIPVAPPGAYLGKQRGGSAGGEE